MPTLPDPGPPASPEPVAGSLPELARLVGVMSTLRLKCPWDAQQTHRSLVQYLVEETCEVVEAVESGDRADLREELGDLLLQVLFHAEIASEDPEGFDLSDVARGVADKLVDRHPHVFGDAARPGVDLAELNVAWEQRKARQKGRTSVLDGIPDQLSAMAKAAKVIGRARTAGVAVALPDRPVTAPEVGARVLDLVARAQASGVDAEQAVRDALRQLEDTVAATETRARSQRSSDDEPR